MEVLLKGGGLQWWRYNCAPAAILQSPLTSSGAEPSRRRPPWHHCL